MGGGSPFGEGRFERLDRATWNFYARDNLPVGHYLVPLTLMIHIKNTAQDANGNWWHLLLMICGFLWYEFDVIEVNENWPPLSQTPDFWGVFEEKTSVEYFDVSSNNLGEVLFTPLSSEGGFGKHGPIIPSGEDIPNNWGVVYDMYPKKPILWCQISSNDGYNEDFSFANAKTEEDQKSKTESALVIGVRDPLEDMNRDRPGWPRLDDNGDMDIGDIITNGFFVAGGYSSNMFNLILAEDPLEDFDGDGIEDSVDNCPNTPNPDQSDVDGDGIGDVCDNDGDDDDDDIVDSDGDGIEDLVDNCPYTPNPDQSDVDGDGIGDVCDNDGDDDDDIPPSDDDDDDDVPPSDDDDDEEEITIADIIQKFLSKEISFIDMILGIFSIIL